MNFYRVVFSNATVLIAATDSDMACINAAKQNDDAGDLLALALIDEETGLAQELVSNTTIDFGKDEEVLEFIRKEKLKRLPKRRQGGLTLSYAEGDLFVSSFGYSASLCCAWHECELEHNNDRHEPKQLSEKQRKIVDEWMRHEDDYYVLNGWKTWDEVNG